MASYVVVVYGPTTPTGEFGDIVDEDTARKVLLRLTHQQTDPAADSDWTGVGYEVSFADAQADDSA